MTITIGNIHSGGNQNISGSSGLSSSNGGTITAVTGDIAVLIFATARTDTTSGTTITKITGVTASGLTFVEVFDKLDEYNVGGSFPYTNWHLQMFAAPVASNVTSLAWSTTQGPSAFANQCSCIGFSVTGVGNYTHGFDGDVDAASATKYLASNTNTSLEQPTVNLTTTDANTLLLSIFNDSVSDGGATSADFTANTGYTRIANVQSPRQYALGNLMVQYKTVTSTQAAVAQEPAALTRKFWQAATLAFTESGTPPGTTSGRVATQGVEVLHTNASNVRVTTEGVEVLHANAGNVRMTALGAEVLRSVAVLVVGPKPPIMCVIT